MTLEGSIQDFELPDILQLLRQQKKTGVLTIQTTEQWTKVFFESGMIVSAVTPETEDVDWIAKRLVQSERIPDDRIKEILKNHPDKSGFETALLQAGLISSQELTQFFDLQTKETLFLLFRLQEGRYSFESTASQDKSAHATAIDVDVILLEGMRQFDEWPFVKKQIPSKNIMFEKVSEAIDKVKAAHGRDPALEGIFTGLDPSKGTTISSDEMAVYQLVDGQRDVHRLIEMARIDEFHTCKALSNLLSSDLIFKKGESAVRMDEKPVAVPSLSSRDRVLMRSSRFLWNASAIVFLSAWVFAFGPAVKESILSPIKPFRIIQDELTEQKKIAMQEAVQIYYLKISRLPRTLGELRSVVPHSGSIIRALEKRGVPYRIDEGGFEIGLEEKTE